MPGNESDSYALTVSGLHKRFGSLEVLKGVSLLAREGDVISILGSSGSGKSTLAALHQSARDARRGRRDGGGRDDPDAQDARRTAASPPTGAKSTASAPNSAWCFRASIFGRT